MKLRHILKGVILAFLVTGMRAQPAAIESGL
jgi:hypothetical protein